MSDTPFTFDQRKAIEAIIYLSDKIDDPDRLGVCKLLYFADKTSLEKYGRFIFGDDYSAMKVGPVPSRAYDLMKAADETTGYGFVRDGYRIVIRRKAELEWLSESDKECLDQIINIYGKWPNWKRVEDSHDDAWRAAWDARGRRRSVPIALESIIGMFEDSEDLQGYVFHRDA